MDTHKQVVVLEIPFNPNEANAPAKWDYRNLFDLAGDVQVIAAGEVVRVVPAVYGIFDVSATGARDEPLAMFGSVEEANDWLSDEGGPSMVVAEVDDDVAEEWLDERSETHKVCARCGQVNDHADDCPRRFTGGI